MHITLQRKVAQGNEGLWFVMQRISGARRWVPLAGVKISRQEAETYLAKLEQAAAQDAGEPEESASVCQAPGVG
jgi:hypothetical protein